MEQPVFKERANYKWWVLVAVAIGSVMVGLDSSVLAAVLPQFAHVFRVDSSVIAWVNIAYLIISQSLMLTLSKVGDAKGRKRVFLTGLAFYTCGLIVCASSQSITQLIVGRTLQGVGGATCYSLGMAIVVAVFPAKERGKALGTLASANSIGLVVGPMTGGLLLDLLSWRAVFYTRIPLALIAFVMTWIIVSEQKGTEKQFHLDLKGSFSLFGFLSALLLFLTIGSKQGFAVSSSLMLGVLSIILFVSFLIAEKRALQPIIQLDLFKNRLFSGATASSVLMTMSSIHIIFLVPFYLTQGLNFSGTTVGMFMALLAVPFLVVSPMSGRLSDRIGSKFLTVFGMVVTCAAILFCRYLGPQPTYFAIGTAVLLAGIGFSIFTSPNNSAIMGSVPKEMLGTSSAVAAATRQIGISSGMAIAGAMYSTHQSSHLGRLLAAGWDPLDARKLAVVAGFNDAMMVALIVGIICIVTCMIRGPVRSDV